MNCCLASIVAVRYNSRQVTRRISKRIKVILDYDYNIMFGYKLKLPDSRTAAMLAKVIVVESRFVAQ